MLRMKHKFRIVVIVVVILIIIATGLLFEELVATEWSDEEPFDQQMKEAFGLQATGRVPRLKNLDDLNNRLYGNGKDADRLFKQTSLNKTMMYDEAVERLFDKLERLPGFDFSRRSMRTKNYNEMVLALSKYARTKSRFLLDPKSWETSYYRRFHHNIRSAVLYDPKDPVIDGLIKEMRTDTFETVVMMTKGTELKLLITMKNGVNAVFKPMRWGREVETLPNHYYFNDYERHNSEIASFHLDRVLGFYRVPPVTGRLVNMTSEIFSLAEKDLKGTFYVSPIGNLCFYGECKYYCDSRHSFCGNIDMIEGSLMVWLPNDPEAHRKRWRSLYRRSYSKFSKAKWEEDDNYCKNQTKINSYNNPQQYLLNLVDTHIFDFITGNMDRHHSEIFTNAVEEDSFLIHMDNGRGFGKASVDEYSIIAPLKQCCVIKKSTFLKLSKLYIGPDRLSSVLDSSLRSDPLYPILKDGYYNAVDRRVLHILTLVADCVKESKSINTVIIDDIV